MGIFDKLKAPVFLKEDIKSYDQLSALKDIYDKCDSLHKKEIEREIKLMSYGIAGEERIAFELKNSHIPMYVLHNLYFELDGLSAQIDYLIITRKCIFVVECKNLIGNIEVNSNGDFIRTLSFNGRYKKEGIYSPITQNNRHLDLIKKVRLEAKSNIITRALFEKSFYDNYKSVIVLANPKSVLNTKYAGNEVKNKVVKVDQLINHIKKVNLNSRLSNSSDKHMEDLALFFLKSHKDKKIDYSEKYKTFLEDEKEVFNNTNLINNLKAYRFNKAKEEKVKPYFIFTDKTMMDLIEKMPATINELRNVSGFGDIKCQKYGLEIIDVLNKK